MSMDKVELIRKIADHFSRTTILFSTCLFLLFAFEYYNRSELLIIDLMFILSLVVKGLTFASKATKK